MYYFMIMIGLLCIENSFAQTSISYPISELDFANPERGFYRYSETRSSNYTTLDSNVLAAYRQLNTPPTANYSIYSTLVFRYFFLEDFKQSSITQTYLDNMELDFAAARAAGVKLIPRFAYTDQVNNTGCSSWICPPYGDAPKNWILIHINQIQPILEANKDVIAVVQMGFIGVWGENYYTDYFGDASQGPNYKLVDSNWIDRSEVLTALLNAVPDERMVQVRYPQKKQRFIYGVNALTNSNPLTNSEAFLGTNKSRIGFHNDCLLASADDYGNYFDYGNSSSSPISDTTTLKPYASIDGQFVAVGGETCDDSYSPENNCTGTAPTARADVELERLHYSYLNAQYNNAVNNDWASGGCISAIKRRLGYRFELQTGTYSDAAQPNQVIDVNIRLQNSGYASPYNERSVELILKNTSTNTYWRANLSQDPRFWFSGSSIYHITESLCIPSNMPSGTYEVLLNLPDPMPNLYHRPAYAIRLASLLPDSSDVWDLNTGYNRLGHILSIDNSSNNPICNGETTFVVLNTPLSNMLQPPTTPIDFSTLILYPNPSQDKITIKANIPLPENTTIVLFDFLGQKLGPLALVNQSINISTLPKGIYFVQIDYQGKQIIKKISKN